eukprot:TRINITY_DN1627_c0_g1_i5.p1 TRINITY_DN1627_c0_g1~~TRINITY_DN1627_c0_g1_i5.p1  ORF type:complete len:153 (+),score=37.96 TRINITY_DN1627_c0_g1_i5:130-588(+)
MNTRVEGQPLQEENPVEKTFESEKDENLRKFIFIYSNYGGITQKLSLDPATTVKEVKTKVILEFVHEKNLHGVNEIEKIRLFYLGTELKDDKKLGDLKVHRHEDEPNTNPPCTIHVVILKGVPGGSGKRKSEQPGDVTMKCRPSCFERCSLQ